MQTGICNLKRLKKTQKGLMKLYDNVCHKQGALELEFKTSLLNSRAIGTGERAVGRLTSPPLILAVHIEVK